MPDYTALNFDLEGGVATITLNRPEAANALNIDLARDLMHASIQCDEDPGIRAVVLTGAGRFFCAGGDLKSFSAQGEAMPGHLKEVTTYLHAGVSRFTRMNAPLIGSINGVAAGAGMNLALSCDMRIASDKAMFTEAFVKRGLHPDWGGTYFLPRLVGAARACELIFSGDMINAEEALQLGLVNKVVPHDDLPQATVDFARKFAEGPPIAIGLAKRGIYRNMEADLASALEYETYAQNHCWNSEDAGEGIRAFVEKRPAVFRGK